MESRVADPTYGLNGTDPLVRTIPPDVSVQLIALGDIGAFAALAFADPDRFLGRTIELAGDELCVDHILAAIGRATRRDVVVAAPTRRVPGGTMSSFWGWQADIPALRRIHPALLDFDTWLMRKGKALLEQHFHETGTR